MSDDKDNRADLKVIEAFIVAQKNVKKSVRVGRDVSGVKDSEVCEITGKVISITKRKPFGTNVKVLIGEENISFSLAKDKFNGIEEGALGTFKLKRHNTYNNMSPVKQVHRWSCLTVKMHPSNATPNPFTPALK